MNCERFSPRTLFHLVLLFAVVWVVAPAFATRYIVRSTAECVANSDFIFVGRVLRAKSFESAFVGGIDVQYTVTPTRMLRGLLPPTAVLRGSAIVPDGPAKTFVFFASRHDPPYPGIDGGVSYGTIQPLSSLKAIEKLIDWCERPQKYIDDVSASRTADFLLLTSSRLRAAPSLGGLTRERLIAHFRACFDPSDPELVRAAVQALLRVEDAASAPLVTKLLRTEATACAAAYFLARHPVTEAIKPLCDQLDRTAAEDHNGCERTIAIALMRLNAAEAVPAIRRAVERGLCWEIRYALGFLGDSEDFQRLLPGLEFSNPWASQTGLMHLVARSNLPVEPWMREASSPNQRGFSKTQWNDWLEQNKGTLKINKTGVCAGLKPPAL